MCGGGATIATGAPEIEFLFDERTLANNLFPIFIVIDINKNVITIYIIDNIQYDNNI